MTVERHQDIHQIEWHPNVHFSLRRSGNEDAVFHVVKQITHEDFATVAGRSGRDDQLRFQLLLLLLLLLSLIGIAGLSRAAGAKNRHQTLRNRKWASRRRNHGFRQNRRERSGSDLRQFGDVHELRRTGSGHHRWWRHHLLLLLLLKLRCCH